jgi:hypothetical protein
MDFIPNETIDPMVHILLRSSVQVGGVLKGTSHRSLTSPVEETVCMGKNPKNGPRNFGKQNQGRSLLIDLVAAAIIFAVALASTGCYFIYYVEPSDRRRTQVELERFGSLIMESMASVIREGKATDLPRDDTSYPNLMVIYPDGSTKCFTFDDVNKDVTGGPDYDSLTPLGFLDSSRTSRGEILARRIYCDDLRFRRQGDRVIIRFRLRHDYHNGDGTDDLTIKFGSTVKLRG